MLIHPVGSSGGETVLLHRRATGKDLTPIKYRDRISQSVTQELFSYIFSRVLRISIQEPRVGLDLIWDEETAQMVTDTQLAIVVNGTPLLVYRSTDVTVNPDRRFLLGPIVVPAERLIPKGVRL